MMILHTIVATDEVMLDMGLCPSEYRYENGKIIEGRKTENGFEISRLISTDPSDYLNESLAPGNMLGVD